MCVCGVVWGLWCVCILPIAGELSMGVRCEEQPHTHCVHAKQTK